MSDRLVVRLGVLFRKALLPRDRLRGALVPDARARLALRGLLDGFLGLLDGFLLVVPPLLFPMTLAASSAFNALCRTANDAGGAAGAASPARS
eukprot:7290515-Pyramimonas_sp.AAC.1